MSLHVYNDIEQGTEEWLALRCGMVTASVVDLLITSRALTGINYDCPDCGATADTPCVSKVKRGGEIGSPIKTLHPERTAYAAQDDSPPVLVPASNETSRALTNLLVAERITGHVEPVHTSLDMERGKLDEPYARELYSEHHAPVTEVGFMVRDDGGFRIGYSPDGLVGEDGLIEVKSRKQKIQLKTILDDEVPAENMAQLQTGLLVSGRDWLDYISYCGGMPLYVKRVYPDIRWFTAIVESVQALETNAEDITSRYLSAVEGLPVAERIDHYQEMQAF